MGGTLEFCALSTENLFDKRSKVGDERIISSFSMREM